jgi:two-component SAPR family response regulator
MYEKDEIKLAEKILQLDQLRDELYEELMQALGSRAHELLRALQNQLV